MSDKMDAVARQAQKVADRHLPEIPYQLGFIRTRGKYPTPTDFWYTGESARLQYSTFITFESDRGVLMTLPYWDMRAGDEYLPPPHVAALLDDTKKKISFKDYQDRKNSDSPADNEPGAKGDSRQAGAAPAKPDARKDNSKPNDRGRHEDTRPEANPERSKEAPIPGSRSINPRKRHSDIEQSSPHQKKIKVGASVPPRESSRVPGSEAPKSRDVTNGKMAHKDPKSATLHPAVNGHSRPANSVDRPSSASNIHVNGVAARKSGAPTKAAVPELLSPLRLGFDEEMDSPKKPAGRPLEKEQEEGGRSRGDSRARVPELLSPLRLGLGEERGNPAKKSARTREADDSSLQKKPKPPKKIPPLLSPTLPPIVEAELARLKKTTSSSSPGGSRASESPISSGKAKKAPNDDDEKKRPSRIVVLKYKKRNARTVAAILALPSKSHKEALKKERSLSLEPTPPPRARKRPFPAADEQAASEPSSKRAKPAAESSSARPIVPSTPHKNPATSMSRVASNNSQAHTPGERDPAGLTPRGGVTCSSPGLDAEKAATLRQRQAEFASLGGKLKHTKDDIIRKRGGAAAAAALSPAEEKRVAALHFEMILSYMVSFNALKEARLLERKVGDFKTWETLLPHFPELKHRMRKNRPLLALATQLNALCMEQITSAFHTLDPASVSVVYPAWAKYEKKRIPTWVEADKLVREVGRDGMRVCLGPWMMVDDAVTAALGMIKDWAEREGVGWKSEVMALMERSS